MTETMTPHWPAPTAAGAVQGVVALPGSKSQTNRALVLAALADGESQIDRPLIARDTALMADALRALGVTITETAENWRVTPADFHGNAQIDCGLAGTVMRFLPPVAALVNGDVSFDGDARARLRPMSTILSALRTLGVQISDHGRDFLPFTVHGSGSVNGGEVAIDASQSSQFVSGLLLPAARYADGITLHHEGSRLPSGPHVAMTVTMLRDCGVQVDDSSEHAWRVAPGPIEATRFVIEPDLSNAAPFLGAALVAGGSVQVPHWPRVTSQPGDFLREVLTLMGASCELAANALTVTGNGRVRGLDINLQDASELTPVIAALAALGDSESRLRGVGHIRGHETDRITALATEINSLGGEVTETDDGLVIRPRPLHSGLFHTYNDHRMAQAGALLGLAVEGIEIENIATTAKTLPDFPRLWADLVGRSGSGH